MSKTLVNPLADFRAFDEMFDRMFSPARHPNPAAAALPLDVFGSESSLVVRAAVPGVAPSDLDVRLEKGSLTLSGEFRGLETNDNERVYRREIPSGKFARSIRLPEDVDHENATAEFRHGVLTVTLPRRTDRPESRRLEIRES